MCWQMEGICTVAAVHGLMALLQLYVLKAGKRRMTGRGKNPRFLELCVTKPWLSPGPGKLKEDVGEEQMCVQLHPLVFKLVWAVTSQTVAGDSLHLLPKGTEPMGTFLPMAAAMSLDAPWCSLVSAST